MTLARIVAASARTPLGQGALQSALGIRAGKLELRPSPLRDARGLTIATARCRAIADDVFADPRRLELGAAALGELASALPSRTPLPLMLAMATGDSDPRESERAGRAFVQSMADRAGAALDLSASVVFRSGQAAFATALERAVKLVGEGAPAVIVGAVDTTYDEKRLSELDHGMRLYGEHTVDSLVPSEGAAFVLVASAAPSQAPRWATLVAVASGVEPGWDDDAPVLGVALTDVVRRASEGLRRPLGWTVTDANGERHREKEWAYAMLRNPELFDPAITLNDKPVLELGDAGAATGALGVVYACAALRFGFARAKQALVVFSGDGPERAALGLEAP